MRPLLLFGALFAVLLPSCYSAGEGQAPPLNAVYFPTGLALDGPTGVAKAGETRNYLFVASSDFDLQYRSSALASYSLTLIKDAVPHPCNSDLDCAKSVGKPLCDTAEVPHSANYVPSYFCVATPGVDPATQGAADPDPCAGLGQNSAADRLLYPGRCQPVNPEAARPTTDPNNGKNTVLASSVGIGSFATDIIHRVQPSTTDVTGRLFLPVRGDATLHWIDVNAAGEMSCGQESTTDGSCDKRHRAGDNILDNTQDLRQPSEPFGVDATSDGRYIAVTNQTDGSISLYVNDAEGGPTLRHILAGLPQRPVAIAAVPPPDSALISGTDYQPAFLVAYRNAPQVDLLRVNDTDRVGTNPVPESARFVLNYAGSAGINANSIGSDSRGIVIDDAARVADYAACGVASTPPSAADIACRLQVHQPSVFVANRTPSSLLTGALVPNAAYAAGTSELPAFTDTVSLTAGPSRVVLGQVRVPATSTTPGARTDENGQPYVLEARVFVVCFDSRRIFVYDPVRHNIDTIISTGRGPYAIAIDDTSGLGYVAHFTDSYIGVISLDQRFHQSYGSMIASIGNPSPPRASK